MSELELLRQFRDSIANISLKGPRGISDATWAARRIRQLRTTARVYRDQSATPTPEPVDLGADAERGAAVAWVSPGQLNAHPDRAPGDGGAYLPVRRSMDGNFTMPLYASVDATIERAAKPDYEPAWREYHDALSWMQGCKALPGKYLGWNLAEIANDLIDAAYPDLKAARSLSTATPTHPDQALFTPGEEA